MCVCVEGSGDFGDAGRLKPSTSPSETSVLVTQPCSSLSREAWLLCLARRCSIQKANKPPQLPGLRSPLPAAASKTNDRVVPLPARDEIGPDSLPPSGRCFHTCSRPGRAPQNADPVLPRRSAALPAPPFPHRHPAALPRGCPDPRRAPAEPTASLGGPAGSGSPGRSAAARMQTPIVHQDAGQLVCSCEAMRVP